MTSYSLLDFYKRICRLERYTEVPGTIGDFSQQVRKVDISFDFISFYRFFKVTVGGFGEDCQPPCPLTYEVFEKMPYLNEVRTYESSLAYLLTVRSTDCRSSSLESNEDLAQQNLSDGVSHVRSWCEKPLTW